MRRLFAWVAGLVGIAALARLLASRQAARREAPSLPPAPDPADELRRKLEASRDEPSVASSPSAARAPEESLEERRARVHAKAQEAMDAMEILQEPPT